MNAMECLVGVLLVVTVIGTRATHNMDRNSSERVLLSHTDDKPKTHKRSSSITVISSRQVTHFGTWGSMETCPRNTYAKGVQTKWEPAMGKHDDTALNAIRLLCVKPGNDNIYPISPITSKEGQWGDWGQQHLCNGWITGFQLRSEQFHGIYDDTAANNLRVQCSDGSFLTSGGLDWGMWQNWIYCPEGSVINGIKTQVEDFVGGDKDDTSLNNVNMQCTKFIRTGATLISSQRVTHFGTWGDMETCPFGTYAKGVQTKWEIRQGHGDDSALNAIRLLCAEPGNPNTHTISSKEGAFGDWGNQFFCDDWIIGYQLRSEEHINEGDDTAANNLRVKCSNGKQITSGGMPWGGWQNWRQCPPGHVVDGIKTQVEDKVNDLDDTSLNNVDMRCTKIGKPIISSRHVTYFGTWGDMETCPDGTYAKGVQTKWEHQQGGGDDTALNAIRIFCAKPGDDVVYTISSKEGKWGDWGKQYFCNRWITGFQLRSEDSAGNNDNTAANNLRVQCSDGKQIVSGGMHWGDWQNWAHCPLGYAVDGIMTQVENPQHGGETGLNNVDMRCTPIQPE